MQALAPQWLAGCRLRDCWFEPTFHKHVGRLCNGLQIHTEGPAYDHAAFKPWRIQALAFKAIRKLYPDYPYGATFLTNTSTAGSPSTSLTAALCCENGSTRRRQRRKILRRWRLRMNKPGSQNSGSFCDIEGSRRHSASRTK